MSMYRLIVSAARRSRQWLVAGSVIALVAAGLSIVASAAAAAPTPTCPQTAADEAMARRAAVKCHGRVEIMSARSERVQSYSNEDGSTSVESSARPQRVRRPDGSWVTPDASLRVSGEVLVPMAATSSAMFGTGGAAPMVTVQSKGHALSLSWAGLLPKPAVSGDTVTYANVFPDVDLVVRSTITGFSHVLVVRSAKAAANPAVARVAYNVGGDVSLTTDAQGRLLAQAGEWRVAAAAISTMWDSSTDPVSARDAATPADPAGGGLSQERSTAAGPGDRARRKNLSVSAEAGKLVVAADPAWLTDPARHLPIFIDPSWDSDNTDPGWAWAYANYDGYDNADGKAWVGQDPVNFTLFRSFFQFPMSSGGVSLTGKHILSAQFNITLWHSWSCAPTPVSLWQTDGFTTPRTEFSPGFNTFLDTRSANAHKPSEQCGWQPDAPMAFASDAMTANVQGAANGGWSYYDVGLSAALSDGSGEWNTERWKKFLPETAKLIVSFNTYPNTPVDLSTSLSAGCRSTADSTDTSSLPRLNASNAGAGLVLRSRVNDPDGGTVQAVTEVWPKASKGSSGLLYSATTFPPVAVGTTVQSTVPSGTLAEGQAYSWRSVTYDGTDWSSWSPWCEFVVDTVAPAAPSVSAAPGNELSLAVAPSVPPAAGANARVGRPATVTFSPAGGTDPQIAGYLYGVSTSGIAARWAAANASGVATVSLEPVVSGFTVNKLTVIAVDRAGNRSPLPGSGYSYGFKANTAAGWWPTVGTSGPITDLTTAHRDMTLTGAVSLGSGVATFSNGTAATTGAVISTNTSFTVAAWVRITDGGSYRGIVSQDGTIMPGFQLQYQAGTGSWRFVLPTVDNYGAPTVILSSSQPGVVGTWAHIAGVYDSAAGQARLYVNGALSASVAYAGPQWNSTGAFRIGQAMWDVALRDPFVGDIADVRAWQTSLDAAGVSALAKLPPVAGQWGMDDAGAAAAADTSGLAAIHNATLSGGAGWAPGHAGGALATDGVAGAAVASGPAVSTDQSFSVSAWVYTNDASAGTYRTAVAQDGVNVSAFFLQKTLDHWTFTKQPVDAATTTPRAYSTDVVQAGVWTHLVGVYDVGTGQILLYVNGVLNGTAACGCAWSATGPFTIGRAKWGGPTDWWDGAIDDVRVYRGVLSAAQVAYLAAN